MKFKILKYATFLFGIIVFAASCVNKEFNEPEYQYVDTSLLKPVISIADLYQIVDPTNSGALKKIDTAVYIKATVIANDESGNYYKAMVVQDSSAGIEIDIRATGTYLRYPIGQLVYIKCQGLYLGTYGGVYKLGADYNGGVGQIPEPLIKDYLFASPGGVKIKPRVKDLGFTASPARTDYNTLITFKNVQFKTSELGKTYADWENKETSDVYIIDTMKVTADVRTSGYASFAAQLVPTGSGDITAVFTEYVSGSTKTKQLYIRGTEDVKFTQERFGAWFEENFTSSFGTFTQISKIGTAEWHTATYDDGCVSMGTGSSITGADEDWLISDTLDFTTLTGADLEFEYAVNGITTWNDLKLLISTDYTGSGDPVLATWTEVAYPQFGGNDFTFNNSGKFDISSFAGKPNVHIAFKYTRAASGKLTWEISNVNIYKK